jgi:alpha-ketoglutarate-dependent taurine dioxygenase
MQRHEAEVLGAKLVAGSHFVRPPLGVVVTHEPTRDEIDRLLLEHRVVILRGQKPMEREAFVKFAEQFGQVLEWEFGAINDLVAKPDAKNYLYTNRAVPFHWDGAFVGKIPRAILFQCLEAPAAGTGGETLFADTTRILEIATHEQRARWVKTRVTYSTEKVVHYGGTFTSPVLAEHPISKAPIIRFAEPVSDLNPVSLAIEGEGPLVEEMGRLLRDPRVLYAHSWRDGDVVLADNHALLHGRNAFADGAKRRIQRINVL